MTLSSRFSSALVFAHEVHVDQKRKGGEIPYVAHLLAVAGLVLEAGGDEDLAIAALLHDALEDQPGRASREAIAARFGARVAAVVDACTDSEEEGARDRENSQARKAAYVEHLHETDDQGALLVSCADKLHNARSILRDLREQGGAVWDRFNVGREGQLRHYRALADAFLDRLVEPRWMAEELDRVVREIERLASEGA